MYKKILHVDEKVLTPEDAVKSNLTPEEIGKHYAKPVRGYAVISNADGDVLETPNLVLLSGREFLAQKLADVTGESLLPAGSLDLTKFKIRYFGVGTGGADTADQPNKIGPFDNELDLKTPGKFADDSIDNDSTLNMGQRYQYIQDGQLKKIQSDGGLIEIVQESHDIVIDGQDVTIDAFTTIKYTMFVTKTELYKEVDQLGPFAFNEAALYTVEHEDDTTTGSTYSVPAKTDGTVTSRYAANYRAFAKFTTLTKWLEIEDSLRIEWYILV